MAKKVSKTKRQKKKLVVYTVTATGEVDMIYLPNKPSADRIFQEIKSKQGSCSVQQPADEIWGDAKGAQQCVRQKRKAPQQVRGLNDEESNATL
jgi:hypothetical protein